MVAPAAFQAPSTAWFIFAALRPITIIGRNSAAPAGAGTSWAAISLHWKIMSWGRTNGAARADRSRSAFILDRKSVVWGTSVSVRVDLVVRRSIKKTTKHFYSISLLTFT